MGDGWKDALRRAERIPREVREPSITDRAIRTHSIGQAIAQATARLGDLPSVIAGRDLTKPPSLSNPEQCWDVYANTRPGKGMKRISNNCKASTAADIAGNWLRVNANASIEIRHTQHSTRWAYVPVPGIWGPIVPPDPKPAKPEPEPAAPLRCTYELNTGALWLSDESGQTVVVKGEQSMLEKIRDLLYAGSNWEPL